MLSKKKLYILLLILLVVGFYIFINNSSKSSSDIKYITSKIDRGDIVSYVISTGTLTPTLEIEIRPEVSGTVKEIYLDINSKIQKDQILASLDPKPFQSILNEAQAKYNKALIELNLNKDIFNTNKVLYGKNLISKGEYDNSRAKYKTALAIFEESKTVLEIAKANLDKTKIRSAIDGTVLSKNINIGQKVSENSDPLFSITTDLKTMNLIIHVSEADIGKIQNGQHVKFRVSAFPNTTFEGKVDLISNSPVNDKNIVTYDVTAIVDNPDLKLKPGMSAEVNIITSNKKNVLRIPTAALRFFPPSKKSDQNSKSTNDISFIWIRDGKNSLKKISLKTGAGNQEYTEILDDSIDEGLEVFVDSYKDGTESKSLLTLPQPKRY